MPKRAAQDAPRIDYSDICCSMCVCLKESKYTPPCEREEHAICLDCITRISENKNGVHCSYCSKTFPVALKDLRPEVGHEAIMTRVKVSCPNAGCEWGGPLREFERHVEHQCEHRLWACPVCDKTDMTKTQLRAHCVDSMVDHANIVLVRLRKFIVASEDELLREMNILLDDARERRHFVVARLADMREQEATLLREGAAELQALVTVHAEDMLQITGEDLFFVTDDAGEERLFVQRHSGSRVKTEEPDSEAWQRYVEDRESRVAMGVRWRALDAEAPLPPYAEHALQIEREYSPEFELERNLCKAQAGVRILNEYSNAWNVCAGFTKEEDDIDETMYDLNEKVFSGLARVFEKELGILRELCDTSGWSFDTLVETRIVPRLYETARIDQWWLFLKNGDSEIAPFLHDHANGPSLISHFHELPMQQEFHVIREQIQRVETESLVRWEEARLPLQDKMEPLCRQLDALVFYLHRVYARRIDYLKFSRPQRKAVLALVGNLMNILPLDRHVSWLWRADSTSRCHYRLVATVEYMRFKFNLPRSAGFAMEAASAGIRLDEDRVHCLRREQEQQHESKKIKLQLVPISNFSDV